MHTHTGLYGCQHFKIKTNMWEIKGRGFGAKKNEIKQKFVCVNIVNCAVTNHSAMHKVAWNVESGISKFILDGDAARFCPPVFQIAVHFFYSK